MKRKFAWTAGIVAIVSLALAQGSGTSVLQSFVKSLNEAPALSVDYTTQVVGGSPTEFSIDLQKPNKARIESPSQLIVADGNNITTLDRGANSYFKAPQTEETFSDLFKNDDVSIWKAFFDSKAFNKVVSAKLKGEKNMSGMKLRLIEYSNDPQGRINQTMYLDDKNILRRLQTEVKDESGSLTTILVTKSLDGSSTANKSEDFVFNAPAGSKELTQAEMNSGKIYYDLEEAKKIAAATKKKIMIDFYADW
jgi:outer membrane lipoprotein-sorting protein